MFSPDSSRILTALDNRTVWQYLVASEDLRRVAACRVGRELSQKEITRFQMHETLSFHFDKRQCPPVFSWEQATK